MSLEKVVPTKANLMKTKESLAFAKKGYELLDKKRTVLVREMMSLHAHAKTLEAVIAGEFVKSFESLKEANLTMGSEKIEEIANAMPKERPYDIQFRSVMGVELPKVLREEGEVKTTYSFYRTTAAFDKANLNMQTIGPLIYELAEMETAIFRLAGDIKKTKKRANALQKIQIPKYEAMVKEIEEILEEKEREDFFRLKRMKGKR